MLVQAMQAFAETVAYTLVIKISGFLFFLHNPVGAGQV